MRRGLQGHTLHLEGALETMFGGRIMLQWSNSIEFGLVLKILLMIYETLEHTIPSFVCSL